MGIDIKKETKHRIGAFLALLIAFTASIAAAEVLYSHTPTTNGSSALATSANVYTGMMKEITRPVSISSITFKSAATSTTNSITWLVQNGGGVTRATWTDTNLTINNGGEYTGTPSSSIELEAGYYFIGARSNSGTNPRIAKETPGTLSSPDCFFDSHTKGLTFNESSCVSTADIYFLLNGDFTASLEFTTPTESDNLTDFSTWELNYSYATTTPLGGGTGSSTVVVYYSKTSSSTATYSDSTTAYQVLTDIQQASVPKSRSLIQIPEVNGQSWWAWAKLFDYYGNIAATTAPLQFTVDFPTGQTFTSGSSTADLATTCDTADGLFANSLCKMLQAVFYPSQQSIDNFQSLQGAMANKPPFGYIASLTTAFGDLSANASSTIDFSDIEGISFFDDVRDLIIWVLWLLFGFWVYNKFRHMKF